MSDRMLLRIPDFDGFGEQTYFDHEANSQYEGEIEHRLELEKEVTSPELRLDRSQIEDALFRHTSLWNDEAKEMWAKAWGESWAEAVEQATDMHLDAKFDGLSGGDITISVDVEAVRAFFVMSMLERHETYIGLNGVGLDGYVIDDINSHEAGLLFQAVLDRRGLQENVREATRDGVLYDSDLGYQMWDKMVAWAKLEADLEEARQDLLAKLATEKAVELTTPRCPNTPDLFELIAARLSGG